MLRNFEILTDSATDLPKEYFIQNNVTCVQLGCVLNGETYGGEHGKEMDINFFYNELREGAIPTTFQITPEIAKFHLEEILKKGKDVLAIIFSSGLSGTAGSFMLACKELKLQYTDRKIYVIDSLCASMGEGLLVDYAVNMANSGASIEETYKYINDLKLKICHEFTVDNLFHLRRGGRISTSTAVIGTMLQIKPVLHVDNEGYLTVVGKCLGRKKAIRALFDKFLKNNALKGKDPVFISHGDCIEDVKYLISLIKSSFENIKIVVNYIGSVIGTHSGVGTLALFYKGVKR